VYKNILTAMEGAVEVMNVGKDVLDCCIRPLILIGDNRVFPCVIIYDTIMLAKNGISYTKFNHLQMVYLPAFRNGWIVRAKVQNWVHDSVSSFPYMIA
jgi:hypothetical protein